MVQMNWFARKKETQMYMDTKGGQLGGGRWWNELGDWD